MSRYSELHHLECGRCATYHDAAVVQGTCTSCGSPLLARYDLERVGAELTRDALRDRPADMWRYHELLPVGSAQGVVSLGEGMTPLIGLPTLGRQIGLPRLMMKDEGSLPTGTFKARGAASGLSRARELGIESIAMPTNGNAGAAWAAYAARGGLAAYIVMPRDAPEITRRECVVAGARLELVDGLIGDAGAIVAEAVAAGDWFDASTLKEPYRLEGKKTLGLEIAEQLGWRVPDVIIYPTGGGVGIIGIYKALQELAQLGWIERGRMPRLVVVQATGCAPIVRAFEAGATSSEPWQDASTIAFGITVPKALGDFLVLESVYGTDGCAIAVDDEQLVAGVHDLARAEGAFICPEGGATVAAARQLREQGWLAKGDEVALLNTGAGIKYPGVVSAVPDSAAGDARVDVAR